ncbi:MAG: transglutaminase domain-containing protein [Eubacteriales bacterium]|nr:transglutaminase domain-containing protein [Eubacteriales bacterium]
MKKISLLLAGAAVMLMAGSVSVWADASETQEAIPMYRAYNPNSGEHFYTANPVERDSICNKGWYYEGIGWNAPITSERPVYRLYNPNAGDHHYTMNKAEQEMLVNVGWNDEGIGWYSADEEQIPLYRQYNPNAEAGSHNYTVSLAENNMLTDAGWSAEGVAWYAVPGLAADVKNPVSSYKGYDLSSVYDFNEYIALNPDAAAFAGDDLAAIRNFVENGMENGQKGKADYSDADYKKAYYHYKYPKAVKVLDEIGYDLHAAYIYAASTTYVTGSTDPSPGTEYFADYGFDNRRGNCYMFAAQFTEMARVLGYEAYQIKGFVPNYDGSDDPHSWVEVIIDGEVYVCDPSWSKNHYMRRYKEPGSPMYIKYTRMD